MCLRDNSEAPTRVRPAAALNVKNLINHVNS